MLWGRGREPAQLDERRPGVAGRRESARPHDAVRAGSEANDQSAIRVEAIDALVTGWHQGSGVVGAELDEREVNLGRLRSWIDFEGRDGVLLGLLTYCGYVAGDSSGLFV